MTIFKIIFASYMAAAGLGILLIVLGLFIFGFEKVDYILENYSGRTLIILTMVCIPFVKKHIK